MSSLTGAQGTIEHQLKTRLRPVVSDVVSGVVNGALVPRLNDGITRIETHLAQLTEEMKMSTTAIVSGQEISRRFENVREDLLHRQASHEKSTAEALLAFDDCLSRRIDIIREQMEARVAKVEALSFWTLLQLAARKLIGR